jgi:hypothetical protein
VQRHRGRIALGIEIPPGRRPSVGEKWIEVGSRPSLNVLWRRPRQREVEEHEPIGAAARHFGDTKIVRLDVAVDDALLLQMVYGLDQVLAEPAHKVEGQLVVTAQPLREAFLPRPFHQDAGSFRDRHLGLEADNILMVQAAQHLALGADAISVRGVQRDFKNEFALLALTPNDQRIGGAAAA